MDVIITKSKNTVVCETKYDKDSNQVTAVWKGYASPESVKEWGEAFLALMKKHHCPFFLNDGRNSSGPWNKSIEWLESYLVPNLIKEGLKYYAYIVSQNVFSSLSGNELEKKISNVFTTKTFLTPEQGNAWLDEMKKQEMAEKS